MNPAEPTAGRSGGSAQTGDAVSRLEGNLWEEFLSPKNLGAALRRVEANKGAPGVDGIRTDELRDWLREHWEGVRESLDAGSYRPSPARRVTIPKPGGGERLLGVPTALDRLVQQAIAQVLTPIFDPYFCGASFAFRPGKSAHQAVRAARRAIADGHRWVVDVDLDRFFDRVNHDMVMARLSRRVGDRKVLKLVRRFLEAGVMVDGVKHPVAEGTPQGSPLSPLLSNVMLDDLDRELWKRGHRFVRYADDLRVFVRSERAAHRVLDSVTKVVEKRLRLRVNREKSSVRHAREAVLLGFGFYFSRKGVGIRVAAKSFDRLKRRLREMTSRRWSVAMEYRVDRLNRFVLGWMGYFRIADAARPLRDVDEWFRRRMRQVRWKEWKRYSAKRRNLRGLGIPDPTAGEWAASSKGYWRIAGSVVLQRAMPNQYWADLGLRGLVETHRRLSRAV